MRRKKTPVFGPDGQPLCGAKTRAGTPCRGKPMSNGRCRMHGGPCAETNVGALNGQWRGGVTKPRYSGPPLVDDAIADAFNDERRLEQVAEIGIATARIGQLLGQLKAHVNPEAFALATDELIAGMRASDSNKIRLALNALADLRTETRDDDRTWRKILAAIERRRRLVESQRRREAELNLSISRREVIRLATALLECVTRRVTDAPTLAAITAEFRMVLGSDSERTIH